MTDADVRKKERSAHLAGFMAATKIVRDSDLIANKTAFYVALMAEYSRLRRLSEQFDRVGGEKLAS